MSYASPPQVPPKPSSNTGLIAVIIVAVVAFMFVGLCVVGILMALLLPAISAARDVARQTVSKNNMRQITLAMHNYNSTNNSFPPQYTLDAAGTPLHSWRTLILPYLEQQSIFDQIHQDEPWNSANNSIYADTELPLYHSPRSGDTGNLTSYVAIAGEGFVFNGDKRVRMDEMQDGTSNTIMLIEIANSDIAWAEPRDLTLAELQLEGNGARATNVVLHAAVIGFADGSVSTMQTSDPEELRKLLTISGGEAVLAP